MNEQNQSIVIEDLAAQNVEEIKGGPKKIFIGGLSVTGQQAELGDLEPNGDVRGGTKLPPPTTPISAPPPPRK